MVLFISRQILTFVREYLSPAPLQLERGWGEVIPGNVGKHNGGELAMLTHSTIIT